MRWRAQNPKFYKGYCTLQSKIPAAAQPFSTELRIKYAQIPWRFFMLRFEEAPKKPTNLSLNSEVLAMARELGMNVSRTVDALLAEEVKRQYWARWNEQNSEAIEQYNERIEREGLPLAQYRTF
jgi:antitoxin CcdA